MKKYFKENEDLCAPLSHFKKGDVVYEAKICRHINYMFCSHPSVFQVGEKGHCGRECEHYIPRNKKSGNCKYNCPLYEKTDKKIIVK